MAKNDMEVIMYKLLAFIYRCTQEGVELRLEDFCCRSQLFDIPESYWFDIVEEAINKGYIKGLKICSAKQGSVVLPVGHVAITLDGVTFLHENSRMKKAKEFLGQAFEIVLENIVKCI